MRSRRGKKMLPDYEIEQKKTIIEKLMPFIEFIIALLIIQSILTLFTTGNAEEEDTIRFRLLAHSNTPSDQQIKREIQQEIAPLIEKAIANTATRQQMVENLMAIETEILEIARSIPKSKPVSLERTEALFPPKRSGLYIHPQAMYDAYILTIGSGRGDNWWCALFPKVCYPDEKDTNVEKQEKKMKK